MRGYILSPHHFFKMNKYLDLLFKAIGKIDADYFFTEDIYSHIQYNERVFCYELYHVLRLIDVSIR